MGGRPKPFDQQGVAKKKGKARKNRMDDTSENGQQSQNSEMGTDQSAPLSRRYKIHDPKNTAPSQGSGDSFESKTSDQADGAHHGLHPMSPTISVSSNAVSSTSTDHDSCHGPRQVNMSSRRFGNSPSGFNPEAPIFDGTASQYRRQLAQQQAQSGHSEPAFAPPFYGQSMYQSHQYENSQPVVTNNFPEGPTFLPGQHASSATYFPQSTVYAPQQVVVYPYPQQQLQAGSYESFGRYNSTNYFTTGATLGPTAPVYNPQELYYGQPLQPHPQQGLQNAQYSESVTSSLGVDASSCSPTQTEDAITGMMSPSAQSASDALPDTGCSCKYWTLHISPLALYPHHYIPTTVPMAEIESSQHSQPPPTIQEPILTFKDTGQFYMRDATEPIIHDYLARCQLRLGSLGARIKFYLVEKERLGVNMPLLNEMAMYDDLLTLTNNQKAIYKEMLQSFDGIVGADEELPADKKKLLDSIQEDVKRACEAELAYKQAKTIVYS